MRSTESPSLIASELAVSLTVKDLSASQIWYRDVLGFAVTKVHEREGKMIAVSLSAGDVRLLLGQDDGAKGTERSKGEGLSIQITTSQDIDRIADRVRAANGSLDTEPTDTPWGPRIFRFRDPDGFRFTVSSPSVRT